MEGNDLYRLLGLSPGAGQRELESSYHQLIRRRPPLGLRELRLVDEAYAVLSDPRRRAEYDRRRGHRLHPAFAAGRPEKARELYDAGRRHTWEGRWDLACRAFRLAVEIQPWEAVYRSGLGLAMVRLGRNVHRGRELCLEALQLDPDNETCRRNLAAVYEHLGLPKRAGSVLGHSTR